MERLGVNAEWNWGDHLRAFTKLFGIADSYELRHLQLGREKTVLDHVYPWNDNFTNLYERHVSFADWLLYSHSQFEVDAPSPELLLASMKVPPSDQALLYATLVKTGGNQPS
jgi:hypothetical protein